MIVYKNKMKVIAKKILKSFGLIKKPKWFPQESLSKRSYENYEEYVRHQASKLRLLDLTEYDKNYKAALIERYRGLTSEFKGANMLCLGARTGSECEAFISLGAFAIGVDLNPGEQNKYVVNGDFHDLQFANSSVDYVFTNALDHSFDLAKVLAEVHRVLKDEGTFYAEIVNGSADQDGINPGEFESLWWNRVSDLAMKIEEFGFVAAYQNPFAFPWNGTQIAFKKSSN